MSSQATVWDAASNGDIPAVQNFLDNGTDINSSNEAGFSILYASILCKKFDRLQLVKFLVEKGADVNLPNREKRTPICEAALLGLSEVVRYLFDSGADIHAADSEGVTPLFAAVYSGNCPIVKFLIDKGAEVKISDSDQITPLHIAASKGNFEIVKVLTDSKCDWNAVNILGDAPIPEGVDVRTRQCRKCSRFFEPGEFAIFVEKSDSLYHSECFKCAGCNQSLADLFYFYDRESDDVYCGRDFAKIRGIPRCRACDELIFVKEYCLAENSTFHLKHFCCFECDQALAGQNYVVEDSQPVCLPCFEKLKANKCVSCGRVIRPDERGVSLAEGIHFHAADECFCCSVCRRVLHGAKLLFRKKRLYCSHDCFRSDQ